MYCAMTMSYAFADLALARRLERAEGQSGADFVDVRARVSPDVHAEWIEVAGAYAMFDGVQSPVTQTFGLGMSQALGTGDLDRIEAFFRDHGAPVFHEVSPLADASVVTLLNERRYQPFEFTSVMTRPIAPDAVDPDPRPTRVRVRVISDDEQESWARTAAAGWGQAPELGDFLLSLGQISAMRNNAVSFIAEVDGQAIATGGLTIHDGVALFAGASTVPEGRRQGAQLALVESRFRHAAALGCDLAMMCAAPGSASQRNAERHGFRIAYTRIKWRLAGSRSS